MKAFVVSFFIVLCCFSQGHCLEHSDVKKIINCSVGQNFVPLKNLKRSWWLADFNGDRIADLAVIGKLTEASIKGQNIEIMKSLIDNEEFSSKDFSLLIIIADHESRKLKNSKKILFVESIDDIGLNRIEDGYVSTLSENNDKNGLLKFFKCKGEALALYTESSSMAYVCWDGKRYGVFTDPDDLP